MVAKRKEKESNSIYRLTDVVFSWGEFLGGVVVRSPSPSVENLGSSQHTGVPLGLVPLPTSDTGSL